jgi:hypothetical protein
MTKKSQPTKQQNVLDQLKASVGIATKQQSKKSTQSAAKQPSDAAKQPSKPDKSAKTIALADVARELNINPKVARAKARRNRDDLPKTVNDDGWVFDAKLKSQLVQFLTS